MSKSMLMAVVGRTYPEVLEVLGLTAMVLLFLIGVSCLVAALFSFNHFFYERRGRSMKEEEVLGALFWHGAIGLVIAFKESFIALFSLVVYFKDHRSGRITFITGVSLIAAGLSCGYLIRVFSS